MKQHIRRAKGFFMHTNLPHINQTSHYQFITFRTKDSTDEFVKNLLSNKTVETKKLQYSIDKYLDNSQNGAYLNDKVIDLAREYLLNVEKSLSEIIAFSIMPNHIHVLLVQNAELAKIVQQIKGGLSFLINKELGKSGPLWQKDYFDKAIRDEKHFKITYEYIKNNAVKANLSDAERRFYSVYEQIGET